MKVTGPHTKFKLSKTQIEQILRLNIRGYTQQEIADITRISRSVIQRVLLHPNPMSASLE